MKNNLKKMRRRKQETRTNRMHVVTVRIPISLGLEESCFGNDRRVSRGCVSNSTGVIYRNKNPGSPPEITEEAARDRRVSRYLCDSSTMNDIDHAIRPKKYTRSNVGSVCR